LKSEKAKKSVTADQKPSKKASEKIPTPTKADTDNKN